MLRSAILGGVDGIVTSFAIVAASDVAMLERGAVVVVGFASLVADAGSMAASEYLAVSTERALQRTSYYYPLLSAVACFAAFATCGLVPLGTYLLTASLLSSAAFSITTLVLLGAARAKVADEPLVRTFAQTALLGSAAGGVAYGVGVLSHRLT